MAKKLKKGTKQFLSLLFHLLVLTCMVLLYDAGKGLVTKFGLFGAKAEKTVDASALDFMESEEELSAEIDPALAKGIAKNDEGYLLRTDIPYPPHLKVIVTDITKFKKVRTAKRVGDETVKAEISSRMEEVMEYQMAGGAVRFTKKQDLSQRQPTAAERVEKLKAIADAEKNGQKPPPDPDRVVGDLVGKIVQFNHKGNTWEAVPTGEFKTMAWGKSLEDEVGEILVANGLLPKRRWFGNSRIPIGHKLKLSGSSLGIVFDNAAKGNLEMEFTGVGGVHGHPCAVFDVSGSIELKEEQDAEGRTRSGEETIESGKVWFSLLYPVVLRKEMDLIVSYDTREKGKLVAQFQGKAWTHTHADWKAVTSKPKPKPESGKK